MRYLLLWLALLLLASCSDDALLSLSKDSSCIRNVIDSFIEKESCQKLSDNDKSMLAHKLVTCFNIKHGKKPLEPCETPEKCSITGEDWVRVWLIDQKIQGTFTTFFAHIDNLCHFYWEVLHHERTENLIGSLSQSALFSEKIMKKNYESTEKILSMQEIIKQFMEESLKNNEALTSTLSTSEARLQNMTKDLQTFFKNLHQDIDRQYSSLSNILHTINHGIEGISMFQQVMRSDLGSIFGVLYFLVALLILVVVTSFHIFRAKRGICLIMLFSNLVLECVLPALIIEWMGCSTLRFLFAVGIGVALAVGFFNSEGQVREMTTYIDKRLETQRIKRIFKEIVEDSKRSQST